MWKRPRASFARGLGGLDDLARAEAARADAQPLNAAVDERAHPLQVRLEPPRGHVMRVTDVPTHDGTLIADFTTFCHWLTVWCSEAPGSLLGRPRPARRRAVGTNVRLYTAGRGDPTTHTNVSSQRSPRHGSRTATRELGRITADPYRNGSCTGP